MKENKVFPAIAQKAIQHSTREGILDKETRVIFAVQCKYKVKKKRNHTQQKG